MSTYLKPQSPLYHKTEDAYFYPLTTADQIIMEDGSRLDEQVAANSLSIDLNEIVNGTASPVNADTLGGITAENYAKLSDLNNAMSIDLLWQNASPTSSFPEHTETISNLNEYKWLLIGCFYSASGYYDNVAVTWSHVRNGMGKNTIFTVGHNNSHFPCSRYVEISNDGITFSTGYSNQNSSSYPEMCIPLYIYGIKGVSA